MSFELSDRMAKLLDYILEKGSVTSTSRPFLTRPRFYNYLWMARDAGLVTVNGLDEDTHQKQWVLTEKGKCVAKHIKEIKLIVEKDGGG